jgi:hypothetical protein
LKYSDIKNYEMEEVYNFGMVGTDFKLIFGEVTFLIELEGGVLVGRRTQRDD